MKLDGAAWGMAFANHLAATLRHFGETNFFKKFNQESQRGTLGSTKFELKSEFQEIRQLFYPAHQLTHTCWRLARLPFFTAPFIPFAYNRRHLRCRSRASGNSLSRFRGQRVVSFLFPLAARDLFLFHHGRRL